MHTDAQGNILNGATPQAAAHYTAAVNQFNAYRGDPIAEIDAAIAAAPGCAMARLFKAHLLATATEPAATQAAVDILNGLAATALDDREASHATAIRQVTDGNWTHAATTLDHHSMRWPHDMVALQAGHLVDFFRASARSLRDRIARTLPLWPHDMPGRSYVLGMYAFGLEEAGDYARAEEAGRAAVAADPADSWAHHAVAHVMEMQGRAEDGIGWMQARQAHWADDSNFFQIHNWWHQALFHLDLEQHADVLALYDTHIRAGASGIAVNLVDASALLWRLALIGVDTGDRWHAVAEAWQAHADGALYSFNDLHAAMAYLGAGRLQDVDALLDRYRANAHDLSETGHWQRAYGLPLIEGFKDYWTGNNTAAVDKLHRARGIANGFGGSHAQRDVIDWTLIAAAMRGKLRTTALSLAHERLAHKPFSPVNRAYLAQARSL